MERVIPADLDMPAEEVALNDRIAALLGFRCWERAEGRCDGERITRCGACGGSGHANCYGNGTGPVRIGCCRQRPAYTQNIEAAWEVIALFDQVDISRSATTGLWWAIMADKSRRVGSCRDAASAPEAICRAALDALTSTTTENSVDSQ